jgi:hypothetical protein
MRTNKHFSAADGVVWTQTQKRAELLFGRPFGLIQTYIGDDDLG